MGDADFPYDEWVSDAMRSVLRRALSRFSDNKVLGDHHLYISFNTNGDNVTVPSFLKAQYPDEITIVLQHQFKDLYLDEHGFEVTLSFSGQSHRLYVPFEMVTSFADPSVNFGIQIKTKDSLDLDTNENCAPDNPQEATSETSEKITTECRPTIVTKPNNTDEIKKNRQNKIMDNETDSAEVINIEAFRKR